MPKEEDKKTRDEGDKNDAIDREVLDVIHEERRKAGGQGPVDAAAERKKEEIGRGWTESD